MHCVSLSEMTSWFIVVLILFAKLDEQPNQETKCTSSIKLLSLMSPLMRKPTHCLGENKGAESASQ